MTIPFQTRDYRDTINDLPYEEEPKWAWCDTCDESWLEGEYTRCPGCNPA